MTVNRLSSSRTRSDFWSLPQSAADRQLVVLIENGGIDLGIPNFVDRVIRSIPHAGKFVSDDFRARLVKAIEDGIKSATDTLLESADLALNEFGAARPTYYGEVTILRDSTATFAELKSILFGATKAGRLVDLFILAHGNNGIYVDSQNSVGAAQIRALSSDFGGPLSIRSVYMMNCVGSSLNGPWLDAGARTSVGSHRNNYLPEPTLNYFWTKWKRGDTFEAAATGAYRDTIATINGIIHRFIATLPPPLSLLANQVDAASWDFVQESRPEVAGTGSLTISSDSLPPATSAQQSTLVTTVLPALPKQLTHVSRAFSSHVSVSPAGQAFIAKWERPLLPSGSAGDGELARRIAAAEDFLTLKVPHPLSQSQVDALVSFACGIGAASFTRSKVLKMLESGDFSGVPAEIGRWTLVRTADSTRDSALLTGRRRAEAQLFSGASELAVPASREVREFDYQQNPLAAVTAAEAIQIGLGAISVAHAALSSIPYGHLNVSWEGQSRLLMPEAKLKMPGADAPMTEYVRDLIRFPQVRSGTAYAQITIAWQGNAYGEIGTPVVKVDADRSSDWSRTEGSLIVKSIRRITPKFDPRGWPLCYHYEGSFDPVGNGDWKFHGDFDLDAFGSIRFFGHQVADHSMFGNLWGADTFHGPDVAGNVPTIPTDQLEYLREHLPG